MGRTRRIHANQRINSHFMFLQFVFILLQHYQQGTIFEVRDWVLTCRQELYTVFLTKLFEIWNHIHHFPLSVASSHQAFFSLVLTTFVHHRRALEEFRNYFFYCRTALAAFLLRTLWDGRAIFSHFKHIIIKFANVSIYISFLFFFHKINGIAL